MDLDEATFYPKRLLEGLVKAGRPSCQGKARWVNGALGLRHDRSEGFFHFLYRGEPLEPLVDHAIRVQHEYPGFVEPIWDCGEPPIARMGHKLGLAQIALDLTGVVIKFYVYEVRLFGMGVFQF